VQAHACAGSTGLPQSNSLLQANIKTDHRSQITSQITETQKKTPKKQQQEQIILSVGNTEI